MKKLIVFDLDDTLYYEIDFLKSAFKYIANFLDEKNTNLFNEMILGFQLKKDVFETLSKNYNFEKSKLINLYRNYSPPELPSLINLSKFFKDLKNNDTVIGLISDGRSITQRNKLKALKIESIFDKIIISEEIGSEKPAFDNFLAFNSFEIESKFYIGDNTYKDFITPNKLGWATICLLDKGQNIHKQDFNLPFEYLPKYKISNLSEINNYI